MSDRTEDIDRGHSPLYFWGRRTHRSIEQEKLDRREERQWWWIIITLSQRPTPAVCKRASAVNKERGGGGEEEERRGRDKTRWTRLEVGRCDEKLFLSSSAPRRSPFLLARGTPRRFSIRQLLATTGTFARRSQRI